MSDYATFQQIRLKNKILEEPMLQAYREGNFNMQTLQNVNSPLSQIYKQTYNYLSYGNYTLPDELVLPKKEQK
jgi:hypothetical protein